MTELKHVQELLRGLTGREAHEQEIRLWKPIEQQSNEVYSIQFDEQHWIAKVFLKPEEFDDAPRREFGAMKLLAHLDIAPKPIHYERHDSQQKPVVIYEYMEGEMWNRRSPSADELGHLAALWLEMNEAPVEDLWLSRGMERTGEQIAMQFAASFQRYDEWTEAHFAEGRKAAAYLRKLAEQRLGLVDTVLEMKAVLCFSRADPRFANVIGRPGQRLGMIDWEDSGLRDAARDVADILAHPNQEDLLSWEDWQAFLQPYFAERRKLDTEIEQRVHLYNAIFPIFWLSGLISFGIRRWEAKRLGDWTINTINPNDRLRRYLARALAWPKTDFEPQLEALGDLVFFDLESRD